MGYKYPPLKHSQACAGRRRLVYSSVFSWSLTAIMAQIKDTKLLSCNQQQADLLPGMNHENTIPPCSTGSQIFVAKKSRAEGFCQQYSLPDAQTFIKPADGLGLATWRQPSMLSGDAQIHSPGVLVMCKWAENGSIISQQQLSHCMWEFSIFLPFQNSCDIHL